MKRFVVISHVPKDVMYAMPKKTPEEMKAGMELWFKWKEKFDSQVIDMGAPFFQGVSVSKDGSYVDSMKDVAGYMIIEANDLEDAIKMLQDSPLFDNMDGCEIEVHEAMKM